MNLALSIAFYFGLAILALGLLLWLILAVLRKKQLGALIVLLIGLLITLTPVGIKGYLNQKDQHEKQVQLTQKNKRFDQHEKQFLTHIKKTTVATEYVAQKYSHVWQQLIKNGSVEIKGTTYTDYEDALAAEGQVLLANKRLDTIDNQYLNAQSDYQAMQHYQTKDKQSELKKAQTVLTKTNAFNNTATRPNGTYREYADAIYQANQRHVQAMQQLKLTAGKTK